MKRCLGVTGSESLWKWRWGATAEHLTPAAAAAAGCRRGAALRLWSHIPIISFSDLMKANPPPPRPLPQGVRGRPGPSSQHRVSRTHWPLFMTRLDLCEMPLPPRPPNLPRSHFHMNVEYVKGREKIKRQPGIGSIVTLRTRGESLHG